MSGGERPTGFSLEELAEFAAGITPLEWFRGRVIEVLVDEGPRPDDSGSLALPLMCEWATYLDMACDVAGPSFDPPEARRLAGAMCAILTQVHDDDIRSFVSTYARGAPRTVARIREYRTGRLSREGFERFVDRRPWPVGHRHAVRVLDDHELSRFADALEANDYAAVVSILGS